MSKRPLRRDDRFTCLWQVYPPPAGWYEELVKALQLNGKGERTQQAYAQPLTRHARFTQALSASGGFTLYAIPLSLLAS